MISHRISPSFYSPFVPMHQKLRRLDATKSSSRSIVPSQLLHRQAQRRQKQRAPMSTSLPYLRLALDNRLQDVFVDVGDSSNSNTANSSSDSSDASTNLVPLRRFAAVAGPLHATSANAEMGDSKLHSARIIAQPHAFVAALPQLLPLSKATASNSTNDNDDSKKKDDEALGISSEELSAANSAEAGDADTSSTDNSSSSSSSSSSSGTGARLNPIIEGGGGGALGDLLRGQSAQRPSSSTSRWPSVAAVLQRVRSRPEDDDDDDEEEEKAAAAAVGAGRGPALLRALLDQVPYLLCVYRGAVTSITMRMQMLFVFLLLFSYPPSPLSGHSLINIAIAFVWYNICLNDWHINTSGTWFGALNSRCTVA